MSADRRLSRLRGIAGSFFGGSASLALGIVTSILVARWLGPEGKGTFTAVVLLPSFLASACQVGVGSAGVYMLSKKPEHRQEIINNNFLFTAVASAFTVGALIWAGDWLLAGYYASVGDPWLVYAGFWTVPALVMWSQVTTVYRGTERYTAYNRATYLFPPFVDLGFVFVAVIVLGWGVRGAVGGFVAAKIVVAVVLVGHLAWYTGFTRKLSWPLMKESFVFGAIRMAGGLMERGSRRADQAILVALVPVADLGIYSVAATLSELPLILPRAVGTVLYPTISGTDSIKAAGYVVRAMRHLLFWVTLAAIGLAVFGGFAIDLLLGDAFSDSYLMVLLLLPGVAAKSIAQPLLAFFAGTGRPGILNWARGAALLVGLGLLPVLLPRYGTAGVAAASSIGYLTNALVLVAIWRATHPVSFVEIIKPTAEDIDLYRQLLRGRTV